MLGLVLVPLLLVVASCGGGGSAKDPTTAHSLAEKIRVSGAFGSKPAITIATPLKVPETDSWTQTKGTGDPVGAQAKTILQLTLADARTGKTSVSTFDAGQKPLEVRLGDQLFPRLLQALSGQRAGTRLVVAATSEDAYGNGGAPQIGIKAGDPVVMVADILSTDPTSLLDGPSGATRAAPATAPRLLGSAATPTGFDVTGLRKPKKLQVYTLREGTGPAIDGPHRVSVDYIGQVWGATQPFNDSYPKEPVTFTFGLSGVIPAWDKALAGAREGSRVMLVSPPSSAYGATAQPDIPAGSTLIFVLDVLGVG